MGEILIKSVGFVLFILLAYFLKQRGMLKKEDKRLLGALLINVNLPCVVISGFRGFEYSSAFIIVLVLSFCVCGIGVGLGYLASRKKDNETIALHMLHASGYNIGTFTLPLVSVFLSKTAVLSVMMFDISNAIMVFGIIFAVTSAVVTKEKQNPLPLILKYLTSSVPFLTYIAMILSIALKITFPSELYVITDIGASATSFLSMIMIGVMLEFNMKKEDLKQISSAIFVRYAYSLVVAVSIFFMPFDEEIKKALIICVFSPTSTLNIVFSEKLNCKPSLIGAFSSLNIVISMTIITCVLIFL